MKFEWEEISTNSQLSEQEWFEATYRAKVPGGWLIRHELCYSYNYEKSDGEGWQNRQNEIIFVPDFAHRWEID